MLKNGLENIYKSDKKMKYLKSLRLSELYSTHRFHTEKLDDLLDLLMPVMDDYNIREWCEEHIRLRQPNYRFSYAKDNTHMENQHDSIVIVYLPFDKGQEVMKKIESMRPRIEKILNTKISIGTSKSIATPELIKDHLKMLLK